jgi:23S rRNA (cytosine1962-C5)-methyltransferase
LSAASPVLYVPNELSKQLQRGHPWVYRDRLLRPPRLPSGTWVQVTCGTFTGYGLWDARSPIAVRLFSRSGVPDAGWIARQIRRAWELREPIRHTRTSAYRWLYGEGDGVPGVVVDLYNDYAVVETYADSLDVLLDWVVKGLRACTKLKGILFRRRSVRLLWGHRPSRDLVVEENGLRLYVDLFAGQKTGLFLDHRENRQHLEGWCGGKRVLNCFAYTGAFSLYAVRGGAREVVSVDIAPQAIEGTRRNLALNGFNPDVHPAIVSDCFELLSDYASQGERFDLVILDPPSLARAKKDRRSALRAYARLNQAAMECVPAGGLLATASCTSQVSPDAFREMLGDAAGRAGKRLLILREAGQAMDHPVPAHFAEGRYLKFILGRVQDLV